MTSIVPINLLFVCSQNQWRSPTAEAIYRNDSRIAARSADTSSHARHSLSEADLIWADLVLVMEHRHKKQITRQYQNLDLPRIIVLDIPDDYPYMANELVEMLRESVENLLQNLNT